MPLYSHAVACPFNNAVFRSLTQAPKCFGSGYKPEPAQKRLGILKFLVVWVLRGVVNYNTPPTPL